MNFGNEIPTKFERDTLSTKQEENLEDLLSTLVLAEDNKGNFEESISNIKEEFIQILPQFIDAEKIEQIENISDKKEFLKRYVEEISNSPVGWGFTPKLALEKGEGVYGFDCTGATITLGAICEKHNIPIEIGKQIQHAVIIATIHNEKYYADPRNNKFFKISTIPEDFQNHQLYHLSEDEQDLTASHYTLVATASIDEFIGDAILGNIEELKSLSLGNGNDIPSENLSTGKIIAEKYRDVLIKEDWETVHTILYPHANDFKKNNTIWQDEELRIKNSNEEARLKEILSEVISETEINLGYNQKEIGEVYQHIILDLKEKSSEVIAFLKAENISNPVEGDSGKYLTELKKHILPLVDKEKNYIIDSIENRLTKYI